jgi:hypothetical protein
MQGACGSGGAPARPTLTKSYLEVCGRFFARPSDFSSEDSAPEPTPLCSSLCSIGAGEAARQGPKEAQAGAGTPHTPRVSIRDRPAWPGGQQRPPRPAGRGPMGRGQAPVGLRDERRAPRGPQHLPASGAGARSRARRCVCSLHSMASALRARWCRRSPWLCAMLLLRCRFVSASRRDSPPFDAPRMHQQREQDHTRAKASRRHTPSPAPAAAAPAAAAPMPHDAARSQALAER